MFEDYLVFLAKQCLGCIIITDHVTRPIHADGIIVQACMQYANEPLAIKSLSLNRIYDKWFMVGDS